MANMRQHLTITDEKAAAAFANARTRAILFALMKSDRSLSELQSALGMSLSLLHYHVTRLQRLSLVRVTGTKHRAGRPIRIYRAAALAFRVPGSVSGSTAGSRLKQELEIALEQAEARQAADVEYFLDAQSVPRMRRSPTRDQSAVHQRWCRLRLSARAAAKFNQEIGDLLAKYEHTEAAAGQPHLCYFALVKN
jgi:DNA-binding transcriptional ArsR family regulator